MQELQTNIKRVNDKLQRLLRLYQQLLKDNQRQSKLIKELENTSEKQAQTIAVLQQQNEILKVSSGNMSAEDKKAFEKHINQYLREIDKCIGLLSE
ncbi:MAG: hypothetical protein JST86_08035 [Bacteroidetes bacterium]|nr:hypothetical protein [Bacteroidota bacterium]